MDTFFNWIDSSDAWVREFWDPYIAGILILALIAGSILQALRWYGRNSNMFMVQLFLIGSFAVTGIALSPVTFGWVYLVLILTFIGTLSVMHDAKQSGHMGIVQFQTVIAIILAAMIVMIVKTIEFAQSMPTVGLGIIILTVIWGAIVTSPLRKT